jgi:hypothetical protein
MELRDKSLVNYNESHPFIHALYTLTTFLQNMCREILELSKISPTDTPYVRSAVCCIKSCHAVHSVMTNNIELWQSCQMRSRFW